MPADQDHAAVRDGAEARYARRESLPAAAGQRAEAHRVEEVARERLGGVAVAVSVEPDDAKVAAAGSHLEPCRGSDRAVAIPREHQRTLSLPYGIGHGLRDHPVQREGRSDLRRERAGIGLQRHQRDVGVMDLEPRDSSRFDEVKRPRAHAPAAMPGIVGDLDQVNRHAARSRSAGRPERFAPGHNGLNSAHARITLGSGSSASRPRRDPLRLRAALAGAA